VVSSREGKGDGEKKREREREEEGKKRKYAACAPNVYLLNWVLDYLSFTAQQRGGGGFKGGGTQKISVFSSVCAWPDAIAVRGADERKEKIQGRKDRGISADLVSCAWHADRFRPFRAYCVGMRAKKKGTQKGKKKGEEDLWGSQAPWSYHAFSYSLSRSCAAIHQPSRNGRKEGGRREGEHGVEKRKGEKEKGQVAVSLSFSPSLHPAHFLLLYLPKGGEGRTREKKKGPEDEPGSGCTRYFTILLIG